MNETHNNNEQRPHNLIADRYEIIGEIGAGAIGTVYKAFDIVLARDVAVKVLHSHLRSNEQLVRLQREAKAICQLKHPKIIDVFDFCLGEGDVPILAMEFVEGGSLDAFLADSGAPDIHIALDIFEQICDGLSNAHAHNILHRDLKPANILLQKRGESFDIKIIDFGIAKFSDFDVDGGSLTSSGAIVGTPSMMSPEQARGGIVDQRSEVYSMGCLMYKTLTRKAPFRGLTVSDTLVAQLNEAAPSLQQGNPSRNFSEELEYIVARSLRKNPDERFQSMDELSGALRSLHSSGNSPSSPTEPDSSEPIRKSASYAFPIVISLAVLSMLLLILGASFVLMQYKKSEVEKRQTSTPAQIRTMYQIHTKLVANRRWYYLEGEVSDDQLTALSALKVQRLCLSESSITDEQLKKLAGLPLRLLDLRNTKISDEGIKTICRFKGLRAVLLERCPGVTHIGYRRLVALRNLKVLSLRDTTVSDEDLTYLSKPNKLKLLYVANSPNITDRGMDSIMKLKELAALRVDGTQLTAGAVKRLQELPNLQFIGLGNLKLSDQTMPKKFNPQLTMLDLSSNPFTRKGLSAVLELRALWYLNISSCPNVRGPYIGALRSKFPYQAGKILVTDREAEFSSSEWYFDPDLYEKKGQAQYIDGEARTRMLFKELDPDLGSADLK